MTAKRITIPREVQDELLKLRAWSGLTWKEIAARSVSLESWKCVGVKPRRLTATSLKKWYDLRVRQIHRQVLADTERTRELAAAFAGLEFKDLSEAVLNALRDQNLQAGIGKGTTIQGKTIAVLLAVNELISQFKKNEFETKRIRILQEEAERKQKRFEKETGEAAKKLDQGKAFTIRDINNIRERVFGLPAVPADMTKGAKRSA